MKITGAFNWSILDDSITLRNTDGEAVFTQIKIGNGLQKVNITGLNGKYKYLGDVLHDGEGNLSFTLIEKENEIVRVVCKKALMQNTKFEIISKLGDYSVIIGPRKSKVTITKGDTTVMTCSFTKQNYDMTIDDSENPVLICSIFYGIVLTNNL